MKLTKLLVHVKLFHGIVLYRIVANKFHYKVVYRPCHR